MTLAMMVELESTGIKVNLASLASPRRTSTAMRGLSLSRRAPAKWCALRCSARTIRQVHSHAGKRDDPW
jgi:hypothetical protein